MYVMADLPAGRNLPLKAAYRDARAWSSFWPALVATNACNSFSLCCSVLFSGISNPCRNRDHRPAAHESWYSQCRGMNSNETGRANDRKGPFAPKYCEKKKRRFLKNEDPSQQLGLKGSLRTSRMVNIACRHHHHRFDHRRRHDLLWDELH